MADFAGGARFRINLRAGAGKRRAPRLALYLGTAAVVIPLMILLERTSPDAATAVSAGVKALIGCLCLVVVGLTWSEPRRGRGLPVWLQWLVLAAFCFALAVLKAREALS